MKGAHFPPTFPHPRFLERKLGKELCAKLRFASGDAALRGGRGRSVLSSDGKNQRSPGDGSDERLRTAGAHSHLSPGPPLRGTPSCVLGQFQPAGKTKSDFPSCPGGTDPFVVAKSALFRTPKHGHPSCRSLAPPLPTKSASLGFGGDSD